MLNLAVQIALFTHIKDKEKAQLYKSLDRNKKKLNIIIARRRVISNLNIRS